MIAGVTESQPVTYNMCQWFHPAAAVNHLLDLPHLKGLSHRVRNLPHLKGLSHRARNLPHLKGLSHRAWNLPHLKGLSHRARNLPHLKGLSRPVWMVPLILICSIPKRARCARRSRPVWKALYKAEECRPQTYGIWDFSRPSTWTEIYGSPLLQRRRGGGG